MHQGETVFEKVMPCFLGLMLDVYTLCRCRISY